MFVYIGLGNELNIAKSFLNNNKKLEIIDATYGLNYNNKIEELWIAPNNFLMLVKNIKASLNEYIDNEYQLNCSEEQYNEIYKDISWMDADLRSIAKDAKENNVEAIAIKQADNATTWNGQTLWVGEESERPGVGLQFCLAPIEEV